MLGLSAAGAADPIAADANAAAAEHAAAPDKAMQAQGKPGAAQLARDAPTKEPLERRLAARGMKIGNPIMIRIFKSEAELELWARVGERFELFATYPICNWSGTLGPKLSEGDKQSPEGLYAIGRRQLRYSARWRHSLDLGYPNAFDRSHARTGSYVLLHGGCTSTGCFAMTDPAIEEIFSLSRAALRRGQRRIQVHVFPFRMTAENLAGHTDSYWQGFWANLKEAYDLFERTRLPPSVSVCERRYVVREAGADEVECPVPVNATDASRPHASQGSQSADVPAVDRRRRRNVMRAYAAARRARLAAKAKQRHARHAAGQRRLQR
jgi:murein L,D-transpeptidase YafK